MRRSRAIHPAPRTIAWVAIATMTVVGSVRAQDASEPAGQRASSGDYIERLVEQARHDDPRVRYSVREALRVMGPPAIRALIRARRDERDPHVRAFFARAADYIKRRPIRFDRDERPRQASAQEHVAIDIDRIAVEARLRWPQIARLEPLLERARKEIVELLEDHRQSGARRDRRAREALRGELRAIAKEIEPKLARFLDSRQIKRIKRSLDQVSDRRDLPGPRGRHGRGEGGRGRGGRGGRS